MSLKLPYNPVPSPRPAPHKSCGKADAAVPIYRPEYVFVARELYRLGGSLDSLARALNVTEETAASWQKEHVAFSSVAAGGRRG